MTCINATVPELLPLKTACSAFGLHRSVVYRHDQKQRYLPVERCTSSRSSPLALSEGERDEMHAQLCSERFVDCSPAVIYATLLDESRYVGSVRTMYRYLQQNQQLSERRNQLVHPPYAKPELLAIKPNRVWSWDITKLKGMTRGVNWHLYVILDIYSRCVVGWMVAARESAELAEQLIAETIAKQAIEPNTLTLHADRGSSMRSKTVAQLLVDLEVRKSHSRPHVSDDNPYSESQFKTMKYHASFPARFGSLEDARAYCQGFFRWYNEEHRHSGIGYHTPSVVHAGQEKAVHEKRQQTLTEAFARHPRRFKGKHPEPPRLPQAAWINPPQPIKKGGNNVQTLNGNLH